MVSLTDETLVAYVDGQLDAETCSVVEAALADDVDARETVRRLKESALLAHDACNEALHWDIPPRLLETLEDKPESSAVVTDLASRRTARRGILSRPWSLPLAASVALAIGLGGGYGIWGGFAPGPDPVNFASTVPLNTPLHRVLETAPSGQPVAWEDTEQQLSGEITPLLTFRDAAERYCREYQSVEMAAGRTRGTVGIACRDEPAGRWTREITVAGGATGKDGYRPAGAGHAALETYVNEMMTHAPLDPSAENALIGGGWQ